MGSCLSSNYHSPPADAPAGLASGGLPAGPASLASSLTSALASGSKRWRERSKAKKNQKQRRGGGGGRGGEIGGGGGEDSDELYRVPGRMFVNGSSEAACLFTQQGKKGTNQDAMLVWENYTLRSDTIFCGVFDGHGPFGHMVAKKVRDSLPLKLRTEWKITPSGDDSPHQNGSASGSMNSEESAAVSIDDEESEPLNADENIKLPDVYPILKKSLLKAFKLMDKELKFHPTIDCFCSGTTAVTVIKQGQDLVIGNVGDSRAILATRDKDNNLIPVQLTVDLKPNLPREAARIQQYKGRVFALQDEPEVARVWLPNSDSPGLAMARAFGDFCLKDYGLISVPDISYRHLTEKDEFIVLATDGVWDVLSNKEVVDVISAAPSRATAARALVECAVRAWRLKFPTSKIDDCAVVCLFLDPPSSAHPTQESSPVETPPEQHMEVVSIVADKEETNNVEIHGLVTEESNDYTSSLEHLNTHHDEDEIVPASEEPIVEKLPGRSNSTRSLAECISATDDEEWSALEGVTRVNSLVNLPRFLSGDRRSGSRKK